MGWHPRDHPRPCGEKLPLEQRQKSVVGSPPPMRGKAAQHSEQSSCSRITPAHAGKRAHMAGTQTFTRDHPRPCGEKFTLFRPFIGLIGSPPPMRGKGRIHIFHVGHAGITPAHAGKRAQAQQRAAVGQDHPRPCGEKLALYQCTKSEPGSPPPMRGKGG